MVAIPLGRADYHRTVAKEARIQTRNRYFEQNPALTDDKLSAMLSRPGLRRWRSVGPGPIRGVYSQPGSFNDALFVVSGEEWYRVEKDGTAQFLTDGVNPGSGSVSMAGTGNIGETPEYMFMADGRNLWLYVANGYARGLLSGSPANNDTVTIDTVAYKFTTGSVDAGAPAGTTANPWLVKLGANDLDSFTNLSTAIAATGTPGTTYSTALAIHPTVQPQNVGSSSLTIRANAPGSTQNSLATTETGAAIAWGAATLTGGGMASVTTIDTPDDVGVISVGYIASYVVVVPEQGQGINGRFWWIEPGETTIDPLNFATAERAPDPIFSVIVFGDQFWLPGSNTTEVWYFTGDLDKPVLRLQGVTFDRGTWQGTGRQVKESMVIVDSDGGVFQIAGGLKRISNPSIEQRIREAIQKQASRIIY